MLALVDLGLILSSAVDLLPTVSLAASPVLLLAMMSIVDLAKWKERVIAHRRVLVAVSGFHDLASVVYCVAARGPLGSEFCSHWLILGLF